MHMRGKTICEFTVIIEDLGFEADLGFELNLVPRPILILSGSALSFWDMGAIKRNDRCDSRINCIHKMSGQQI